MESQQREPGFAPNAGDDPNPATEAIDIAEVARADVQPKGAAASPNPPKIPLAPMKRVQARFNPLADGLMYLVVFVGGFLGVGCRRALDVLLPSVNGTPFVVGTFVSNILACFLFAMLTEYMATASWLRRRVRQLVSRGAGLGFLGGLSTMSGVMLETMEGLHERRVASALGYLAGSFAGGMIAAVAGVAVMHLLLAKGARKRLDRELALSSAAMPGNAEAASDAPTSVSPDSEPVAADTRIRHMKVADAAHSAAQAALEAASAAQRAARHAEKAVANSSQFHAVVSPQSASSIEPAFSMGSVPSPESVASSQAASMSQDQPSGQPQAHAPQRPAQSQPRTSQLPSFEPKPVTAEIPLVADPTTGEVR